MIEPETGFYSQQYSLISVIITFLIVAAAVASVVAAAFTRRRPHKPPRGKWPLFVASLLCALAFAYEAVSLLLINSSGQKQDFLNILFAAMCAVFFLYYGFACYQHTDLPPLASLLPIPYFVYMLLADFINYKGMANISDNVLQLIMRCAVLVFILFFAKMTAYIGVEKVVKKIFPIGLFAALCAAVCTVPRYIVIFIGKSDQLHDASFPALTTFTTMLFIIVFCMSLFSKSNLSRNRQRIENVDEAAFNGKYYLADDEPTLTHTEVLSKDVEAGPDDSSFMTGDQDKK